jgi:hypothetical protein
MAEPVVVKLKEPIAFGSETITELRLRKPKAKDFRRMPMTPGVGDLLDLAGQLSAQPKPVIDELGAEDLMEVLECVGGFFPGGLGTGPTG